MYSESASELVSQWQLNFNRTYQFRGSRKFCRRLEKKRVKISVQSVRMRVRTTEIERERERERETDRQTDRQTDLSLIHI